MNPRDFQEHLSVINTHWSLLRQAHDSGDEAALARAELMQRYAGAVYRYLLAGVRDPEAAADLSQEFAVRFLEGRFHNANPARGRFRDYVKTCLFHLVGDYRRHQGKQPRQAALEEHEPAAPDESLPGEEQAFRNSWREELLLRTWLALEEMQKKTGKPVYQVLRFRVENRSVSSQEMAEQLGNQLGKALTAVGVRQILHRARETFAELLLEEVRRSLGPSGRDHLEEELAELDLLKYCQNALNRRTNPEE